MLSSTITKYIDNVAKFTGQSWAGVNIQASQITGRALELALPELGNAAQQQVLQQAMQYAKSVGVDLIVNIVQ